MYSSCFIITNSFDCETKKQPTARLTLFVTPHSTRVIWSQLLTSLSERSAISDTKET
jgi:hypothetical protein